MRSVLNTIRQDYRRNRDPLARLVLTVFRFGQWTVARRTLPRRLCGLPYKVLNLLVVRLGTNSDLPREVSCGPGLRLFHPYGLILHPGVRLGANIDVYHRVTIGRRELTGEPIISDEVTLGTGAVVLGPVVIGPRAKIAAGATVLDDVPAGGTALGPRASVRGPATGAERTGAERIGSERSSPGQELTTATSITSTGSRRGVGQLGSP